MEKTVTPKHLHKNGIFTPSKEKEFLFESPNKNKRVAVSLTAEYIDECPVCRQSKFIYQKICGECHRKQNS